MRKRTIAGLTGIMALVVLSGGVSGPAFATGGHGHGHAPVTICHNGHTITVDDSAVPAHLKHGDVLGECTPAPEPTTPVETPAPEPTTPPATEEPTPEPTTPPATETPEPEPTTPVETPEPEPTTPVETPAPVVAPRIQDYVTCKGAAFVLDNIGSTVAVEYNVAGRIFTVPAGTAVHTDADGFLFPTDIGVYKITTYPGETTWAFAPPSNCAVTTPPTTEPTTPPTGEPATPAPSDAPTTPAPGSPTPTAETTPPASSPSASSAPTAPTSVPSASQSSTATAAPVVASTSAGTDQLAYTGSTGLVAGGIIAAGLAALGALVLVLRTRARRAA